MLDWDKPLSQQPEVINMLREHPEFGINSPQWQGAPAGQWESNIGARKGSDFYIRNKWADNQRATSDALRQAGIPGIRYLDGTSRGTGQGTSNFVVFPGNEGLLSILERNGQPLP